MILDSNRKDVYLLTDQSFTKNKAVINEETVQICCSVSQPRFNTYQTIHPLRDAAFGADCLKYK